MLDAPRESRTRRAIREAVEATGRSIDWISYVAPYWTGDQLAGGWDVMCTDGTPFGGGNVHLVLDDIRSRG